MTPTSSEQAAAVLNLVGSGIIEWDDPEVVTVLRGALKRDSPQPIRQQRIGELLIPYQIEQESSGLSRAEWERIPCIRFELAKHHIIPQRWEVEALVQGAIIKFGVLKFKYNIADGWLGF